MARLRRGAAGVVGDLVGVEAGAFEDGLGGFEQGRAQVGEGGEDRGRVFGIDGGAVESR